MTEELKACPFCGEGFQIVKTIWGTFNLIHQPEKLCVVDRAREYFSEQAAIDAVNTRPVENALRAELDAEKEKHRWIPVSERLPEIGRYVITLDGFHCTDRLSLGRGEDKELCWFNIVGWPYYFGSITHWQSIPTFDETTL